MPDELHEQDDIVAKIDVSLEASTSRKVRTVLSDAFAAIKSSEVNSALATVTFEQLMAEQIQRNGESDKSNSSQFDPYRYDPQAPLPAGVEPGKRANFAGGSDTGRPTKIDRVLAIKSEIGGVIDQVLETELVEVADFAEYSDDEPPIGEEV